MPPVGLVSPGWRDDGVAQEPQQFGNGDGDQSGVQARAGVVLALHGGGDGEVDVGQQADRGPAVPGLPADDLPGVQAGDLLGKLMIFLEVYHKRQVLLCTAGAAELELVALAAVLRGFALQERRPVGFQNCAACCDLGF